MSATKFQKFFPWTIVMLDLRLTINVKIVSIASDCLHQIHTYDSWALKIVTVQSLLQHGPFPGRVVDEIDQFVPNKGRI